MSAFIAPDGANSTGPNNFEPGMNQNDNSLQPPDYRNSPPQMMAWSNMLRDSDILWPRSSFPHAAVPDGAHQYWEWNWPPTGVHVRKKIIGLVLNSSGAAVSGATVNLFNSGSPPVWVDSATSAVDGSYAVGDPNATNCFAVADLAGSPETAGTTIQELTGV